MAKAQRNSAGEDAEAHPRVRASALYLFPDTGPAPPVRRRDGSFVTPVSAGELLVVVAAVGSQRDASTAGVRLFVVVATVSAGHGRTRPQ